MDEEPRKFSLFTVGDVEDSLVADFPGDGKPFEDIEAEDRLEEEAKLVKMPGVSKKPLDPFGVSEDLGEGE